MGCNDGTEPDEEKQKLNEDFIEFIRKQSDTRAPRYTAKLKTYVDFQRKRQRATTARRNYENATEKALTAAKKKGDDEAKDRGHDNSEQQGGEKERMSRSSLRSVAADTSEGSFRPLHSRASSATTDPFSTEPVLAARLFPCSIRDGEKGMPRRRSFSRSRSGEPSDKCGRRRRRRRRRSCGRPRRRRRRSCRRRRRSCRRRRSRRRRRRSCCRRRHRRRRRRC